MALEPLVRALLVAMLLDAAKIVGLVVALMVLVWFLWPRGE